LAVSWFSCNRHSTVKAAIDSLHPPLRSWINTCGSVPLEILFRRARDGRLIQSMLAEIPEARRKIITMALAPGRIRGPAKSASIQTHPTLTPAKLNPIYSYLAYPAYLLKKIWMHGSVVLRFLTRATLLYLPHFQFGKAWPEDVGGESID